MAARNWRENPNPGSSKKLPEKRVPKHTPHDPVQFGPIMRIFALVLVAVALTWLGIEFWKSIKPNKKTALYLINATKSDYVANPLAGGLFVDESLIQLRGPNDSIRVVDSNDQRVNSFGPQKNVALFFLCGDLSADPTTDELMISRNDLSNGSRFDSRNWTSLRKHVEEIRTKGKAGIHRIVILDPGQIDGTLWLPGASANERIEKILEEMGDPTDLWIFIATDGSQRSWYSPELGSSVFCFYVTQGLAGWAKPGAEEISLADLVEYVTVSVSRWARDYRDSTQTPKLISANALEDAERISVVFGHTNPDSQLGSFREYKTSELDPLWEKWVDKKRSHREFPHLLAMIESRLVRLEEARFISTTAGRGSKIFQSLSQEIGQLLNRLPDRPANDIQQVSIEQIDLANFSADDLLPTLRDYLFPKPKESLNEDGSSDEQRASKSTQESQPPLEKPIQPFELPDSLRNLGKVERLKLVWRYVGSDDTQGLPLTPDALAKCVDFVVDAADTNSDFPVLEGQPVDLVELRFLKILRDNIDWQNETSAQMKGIRASVQCRQKSESLIQGSYWGQNSASRAHEHAQAWPLVRKPFDRVEARRRSAEDRLLANQVNEAINEFAELESEYGALTQQLENLILLREFSCEAISILPHLRAFLVNIASLRETTEEIEAQLAHLNDLQGLAKKASIELTSRGESLDSKSCEDLMIEISGKLQVMRDYFIRSYQQRLLDPKRTESDVVFDGLNMLASPIPEWLAPDSKSQRAVIRANIDRWIKEQRDEIGRIKQWKQEFDEIKIASERTLLDAAKYTRFALDLPKYEIKRLPNVTSLSILVIGEYVAKFNVDDSQFLEDFGSKQQPIDNVNDLQSWHVKLNEIDFELRIQSPFLKAATRSLDVGAQLGVLDRLIVENDKLDRAFMDFWGEGNVLDVRGQPPFSKYCQIYQALLENQLSKLEEFKSIQDEKETAFIVDGMRVSIARQVSNAQQVWTRWQASKVVWPEMPTTFSRDETLEVRAILETQFRPAEILDLESLTMGARLQVDGRLPGEVIAFEYSESPSSIPFVNIETAQMSNTIKPRTTVKFRGHAIAEEFSIREFIKPEPVTIVYDFKHLKQIPGESKIQIKNGGNYKADVVFILDCSKSMEDPVSGFFEGAREITNSTRFKFAQEALKTAVRELSAENRFRFGLYAFGHRGEFGEFDPAIGKFPVRGRHPFDDCESLVQLQANEVAKQSDVDELLGKIDPLRCRGITPLYFSILEVANNEYFGTNYTRPRYIVVLTDGENKQFGDDEPSASLPDGKTVLDATSNEEVRDIIARNKIRLLVARISKSGSEKDRELADAGAIVLPVLENDSAKISDAILNAIGRNEYSFTAKGSSEAARKKKISQEPISSTNETGPFVLESFGVESPSQFEVSLEGDETLFFENQPEGLVLKTPNPVFLSDPDGSNGVVATSFGFGNYQVGRLKPDNNKLWFGFLKTNVIANSPTKNFSFRPQRIWAQITDRQTGIRSSAFLPVYEPGAYPIACFEMPPALLDKSASVDVCLWVLPHWRDLDPMARDAPVNQSSGQVISVNKTTIRGVTCERNDSGGTSRLEISCPDNRLYFVSCPSFDSLTRTVQFTDGRRTEDTFLFEVDPRNANFYLDVLPVNEFDAIMNRVDASSDRTGQELDPIYGDKVVWIKFENVRVGK